VANYLKQFGWHRGEPVALRCKVKDENDLNATSEARPYAAWRAAGVVPLEKPKGDLPPAGLLDLTVEDGKEYWLVFSNFNVIMHYNNSNFYAMTVYQLAQAIHHARYPKRKAS
jgi:membrane-bound lytic murein transglycosylase B